MVVDARYMPWETLRSNVAKWRFRCIPVFAMVLAGSKTDPRPSCVGLQQQGCCFDDSFVWYLLLYGWRLFWEWSDIIPLACLTHVFNIISFVKKACFVASLSVLQVQVVVSLCLNFDRIGRSTPLLAWRCYHHPVVWAWYPFSSSPVRVVGACNKCGSRTKNQVVFVPVNKSLVLASPLLFRASLHKLSQQMGWDVVVVYYCSSQ